MISHGFLMKALNRICWLFSVLACIDVLVVLFGGNISFALDGFLAIGKLWLGHPMGYVLYRSGFNNPSIAYEAAYIIYAIILWIIFLGLRKSKKVKS
ncbi:MAG: hypothetical protein A3J54_01605 [Candidatus Ryanbacteria bacterium RIFCSPHIGHO2_02_FULL_45_13b]|uniref:Uncharacterized protein n=1 Tax=Candidatus Ryanbacteria bacterium RIFCSPHIGHO2_02_FULL_45_13b TaxID=1802117 RepID=A0A1G2G9Y7_9BACT|nr:MAG: hypothetical protein A3J54_01605 [Candidatus Ryanbacteria bacterium RIFCSPHIGHO2_02_FULL_45_13b]